MYAWKAEFRKTDRNRDRARHRNAKSPCVPDCAVTAKHDVLYLFACQVEWRDGRNVKTYEELVAALDDPNENTRIVAETLLHRTSPRPKSAAVDTQTG